MTPRQFEARWMRICCLLDWEMRDVKKTAEAYKAGLEKPRAALLYRLMKAVEARF